MALGFLVFVFCNFVVVVETVSLCSLCCPRAYIDQAGLEFREIFSLHLLSAVLTVMCHFTMFYAVLGMEPRLVY